MIGWHSFVAIQDAGSKNGKCEPVVATAMRVPSPTVWRLATETVFAFLVIAQVPIGGAHQIDAGRQHAFTPRDRFKLLRGIDNRRLEDKP